MERNVLLFNSRHAKERGRSCKEEAQMKATIDEDLCTGCEECVEGVPEVFEMNEDGELAKVKVATIPADKEDDVRSAAEDCPAESITIED